MATIALTIPDNVAQRVLDAFCNTHGYQATVDDGSGNQIPNPQTQAQFVRATLTRKLRDTTIRYEAKLAEQNQETQSASTIGF